MAGYFHQLVQHALQPAPGLHSTAALPYSQRQDWKVEAVNAPSPLAGRSEQPEDPAVVVHVEQQPRGPLEMMKWDEPAARVSRSSPETMAEEPHSPPPTGFHGAFSSNSQATPDAIADVTQTRNSIAPRSAPRTEQHAAAIVDAWPERIAAAEPERLRPTLPPAAIRPQLPAAQSQFPTPLRSAAPAPAPEVHIHIGRIELTAASPPAAHRREPAPMKKPMSLDEYLQRRHRSQGTGPS